MQAAVITLDHLAIASLGCYGNPSLPTPAFDELAAGSVVFDQCYGTAGDRDPFNGLTRLAEDLRVSDGRAVLHDCRPDTATQVETASAIAEWRRAGGGESPALLWLRCSAIESPWSAPVDAILARWCESYPLQELRTSLAECGIEPIAASLSPDEQLTAAWPQLLDSSVLSRERIAGTPSIGRLRRSVYAAAAVALDAWLGHVIDLLTAAGGPDSLLIVAAGAGDLAGPHAALSAGCPPLVDPLVHVPLLIRTGTPADGTRRSGLVSTDDLSPTLAEWFHVKHSIDDRAAARSLWPLLTDETDAVRDELLIGSPALGWNLRTLRFACLFDPRHANSQASAESAADRPRLFVKPDDAWDTLDVAGQYQSITDDYRRRIREAADVRRDARR